MSRKKKFQGKRRSGLHGLVMVGALLFASFATDAHAERTFEKYRTAVLRSLDKPNARVQKFDAEINKPFMLGNLRVVVRDCRKTVPEDEPETAVFMEITDTRVKDETKAKVFSGWMFSSSPALSALENPIYDVWALDCKNPVAPPPSSAAPAVKEGEAAPAAVPAKDSKDSKAKPSKR